jgi:hypothetical protein
MTIRSHPLGEVVQQPSRRYRAGLFAGVALVGLLLAGCGDGDGQTDPAAETSEAPAEVEESDEATQPDADEREATEVSARSPRLAVTYDGGIQVLDANTLDVIEDIPLDEVPDHVEQAVLAAVGPRLRQPLLERLIARGDIREENGKVLGMLKTTTLKDGGSGRRSRLIGDVRNVLVDGAEPTPRVAALAALMWGSGTLHQFDPEIPWSSVVITRAQELERGNWSAEGATQAVARATAATIGIIAATVLPGNKGRG